MIVKILDLFFRTILKSGTTWNQVQAKVNNELGATQAQIFSWKPHSIVEIDCSTNTVVLKADNGKIIPIKADKKTIQNLINGIYKNQFLLKYGTEFVNKINYVSIGYSRTKSSNFHVDLRAKLKTEDQTTEKRKKMYHKRNIIVTDFFIKNLFQKTIEKRF